MKSKKFRLIVSMVTVISLVLGTTVFASAATVKLNKKTASLTVGKTTTIKVLNTSKKVTWTTSKKSVVTVKKTSTKTAKITAKGTGTATITAKVGTRKYRCKVTVLNPVGSSERPANPKVGRTFASMYGTFYFKANTVTSGADAEDMLKALNPATFSAYQSAKSTTYAGKKLVGMEFYLKATDRHDQYNPFLALQIIGPLIHPVASHTVEYICPDEDMLKVGTGTDYIDTADVELFNGEDCTAYSFFLIPEDWDSFYSYLVTLDDDYYWLKFTL